MDAKQKYKLKKFLQELSSIKGRHTGLVSVYVPSGYDIQKIINHLQEEQSTAVNIKDKNNRKKVTDSLERMIRHLRLFKKTPDNGLALFAGDASESENKVDIKVWSVDPPMPLNVRLYRCDNSFKLDILYEMLDSSEIYGLIVMDNREATIGLLKGKKIEVLKQTHSAVPGKTKAGGQCLIPGSLVQCSDGNVVSIENLQKGHLLKSAKFSDFSLVNSKIESKWNAKKQKIYKIITKYPRFVLECSGDHKLFVFEQNKVVEKEAKDLCKEDVLLFPEKIKVKGRKQHFNPLSYYNSFKINEKGTNFLIKKRKQKGLTQKALAKKLKLTQSAISCLELKKRNCGKQVLFKLCKFFGLDFKKFLISYAMPFKVKEVKLPNHLNEGLSQFIGYFLGDGGIEIDRVRLYEQSEEVAKTYQEVLYACFGLRAVLKYRKSKNYYQLTATSRPLVRFIKSEFSEIKKALNSTVPLRIMKSSDSVVASFLKGLFDAEGYVDKTTGIGISMNNKTLIQQIQLILLRFSIISSFQKYDNSRNPYSNNPRYSLRITERESLKMFASKISFTSVIKANKLNNFISKMYGRGSVRQILFSGRYVRALIEDQGMNMGFFDKVNLFFYDKRKMSKEKFLRSIIAKVSNIKLKSKLKQIHSCLLLPCCVASIEVKKEAVKMVDISVASKNFIANGLVVHNSQARYARLREEAANEFYKRIANFVNSEFLAIFKDLKGILIGGPGMTKEKFANSAHINNQLKEKILTIKDLSYTSEFGLKELLEKSETVLSDQEALTEKNEVNAFLTVLAKEPGKAIYGPKDIDRALSFGAVEKLLISESFQGYEEFEEKVEDQGGSFLIISTDTEEGNQLKNLGGIAAVLRFPIGD